MKRFLLSLCIYLSLCVSSSAQSTTVQSFQVPLRANLGGTGLITTPLVGQLLIGNGTNFTLATITGTTNQVSVANAAGSITLSTPQNTHTGASPTFAGLTLSGFSGFVRASGGVFNASALLDADIPDDITLTNITQITNRSHTNLSSIGTNTHAQIDSVLDKYIRLSDYASITLADAAAVSAGKALFIDSNVVLSSSPSITSLLIIPKGITITTTGYTLTLSSQPIAGAYQIFSGSGTVTGLKEAYPEWFGTGSSAFQAAINSGASVINLNATTYTLESQITSTGDVTIRGKGMFKTKITTTLTNSDYLFKFDNGASDVKAIVFEELWLNGNSSNHTGGAIYLDNPWLVKIHRCSIYEFGGIGIYVNKNVNWGQNIEISGNKINSNRGGGIYLNGDVNFDIRNNSINYNGFFGIYAYDVSGAISIVENEFGGYYYGAEPIGGTHQAVPLVINASKHVDIINNRFEHNGGTSGTAGYNIRTGYNAITQSESGISTNSRHIRIINNDFTGAQANDQDLNHIKLHYAYFVTISQNHFTHNPAYTGTYYGVVFGTNTNPSHFIIDETNEFETTLTARTTGTWYEFDAFTANDTTPSVLNNAKIYYTFNTVPTVITDFDNGIEGQEFMLVFGDSVTTIDFSGTNLRGNASIDWAPATGDAVRCIKRGTYWFCLTIDATP